MTLVFRQQDPDYEVSEYSFGATSEDDNRFEPEHAIERHDPDGTVRVLGNTSAGHRRQISEAISDRPKGREDAYSNDEAAEESDSTPMRTRTGREVKMTVKARTSKKGKKA